MRVLSVSVLSRVAGVLAIGALVACNPPMAPNPPGPPPPPPPPNTPPVIASLAAARSTMETSESILLSATVEDQESGHDRLTFLWSSPAGSGTFVPTGVDASWQAAADLATPADIPLTLTVVESYQGLDAQGQVATLEHRVSRSVMVRVHNSVKELGDMGLSFLEKFANSSLSPDECLVDFSDNCRGKQSERRDIERNREHYLILDWDLGVPSVTNLSKYNRADIAIPCRFESAFVKCPAPTGPCIVGDIESAVGICKLTAVYEQARWWLCDSSFDPLSSLSPAMRSFFGSDADGLP